MGGSEAAVRSLLEQFARDRSVRVTVLVNTHVARAYAPLSQGPVDVHQVRSYRTAKGFVGRALAMTTARAFPGLVGLDVPSGLDLMHYPLTVPIPRSRVPSVVTVHDVQHHELPEFFSPLERRFRAWAYDEAARSASAVVTPSEHGKAALVRHLGVDPAHVHVVPAGIDLERFTPGPVEEDAAALGGLALPPRFVIYPANMWPHKNHFRLIEALALVDDSRLSLVLTGQDYGRAGALIAQARRLRVDARVHHLGYVSAAVLPALYRRAEGMVFPSLYEGFGQPLLEAMACGCPVASSTRAALEEVIGGAALPFDPEDTASIAAAISSLTGDEAVRDRLVAEGIGRAARFTWAVAAERHRQLYRQVARAG